MSMSNGDGNSIESLIRKTVAAGDGTSNPWSLGCQLFHNHFCRQEIEGSFTDFT